MNITLVVDVLSSVCIYELLEYQNIAWYFMNYLTKKENN